MEKFIKGTEKWGIILLVISFAISTLWGSAHAFFPIIIAVILLIIAEGYKALHWNEYRKDNKRNMYILLAVVVYMIMHKIGGI